MYKLVPINWYPHVVRSEISLDLNLATRMLHLQPRLARYSNYSLYRNYRLIQNCGPQNFLNITLGGCKNWFMSKLY